MAVCVSGGWIERRRMGRLSADGKGQRFCALVVLLSSELRNRLAERAVGRR